MAEFVESAGSPRRPARSAAFDLVQKLHETRSTRQRMPDVTFDVTKINIRGKRQPRCITLTGDALLNMRPRFSFGRSRARTASQFTGSDSPAAVITTSGDMQSMVPSATTASLKMIDYGSTATSAADESTSKRLRSSSNVSSPDHYASKLLLYTDMVMITMDDEKTIRIKMKKAHDYVYATTLAPLVHRELVRRSWLLAEQQRLERRMSKRMSMSLTSVTASLLADEDIRVGGAALLPRVVEGDDGAPGERIPGPAKTHSKLFASAESGHIADLINNLLYNPSTPEGKTRARFVSVEFPKALQESLAKLRAKSAFRYATETLAPQIVAVSNFTTTMADPPTMPKRSKSTWLAWISRRTFSEGDRSASESAVSWPPEATSPPLSAQRQASIREEEPSHSISFDTDPLSDVSASDSPASPALNPSNSSDTNDAEDTVVAVTMVREIVDLLTAYILERKRSDLLSIMGTLPWTEGDASTPTSRGERESEAPTPDNVEALTSSMEVMPTVSRIVAYEVEASFFNVISLRHGIASIINYIVDPEYCSEVAAKLSQLRKCPQAFFGIPARLHRADGWIRAVTELRRAETVPSPTEKLFTLQLCAKVIHDSYTNTQTEPLVAFSFDDDIEPLGADDFFPIFAFVLVQAKLLAPVHLKHLVRLLAGPNELDGQGGYWLTVYEAALEYVRTVALPTDGFT